MTKIYPNWVGVGLYRLQLRSTDQHAILSISSDAIEALGWEKGDEIIQMYNTEEDAIILVRKRVD